MTERRPHWDDDLIDAVRDAVDVEFDDIWRLTEDSILAVIAAVEDWQKERSKWSDIIQSPFEVAVRHNAAEERAEKAEAAIARVRDVCDLWQRRHDTSIRHPTAIAAIPITAVLRALEGDSDEQHMTPDAREWVDS